MTLDTSKQGINIKKDTGSPDKYDLFIQRIDYFQSLVDEKKKLQAEISQIIEASLSAQDIAKFGNLVEAHKQKMHDDIQSRGSTPRHPRPADRKTLLPELCR